MKVSRDDESDSRFSQVLVKTVLLCGRAVITWSPETFPELHGCLQGAVGEYEAMPRGGICFFPVSFYPRAEVNELLRGLINVQKIEGCIFVADAVIELSGSQSLRSFFPGRHKERLKFFGSVRGAFMVAPYGVKRYAFLFQNVIEFFTFGQSLGGNGSLSIRHVSHLDDHIYLMFEYFLVQGLDEIDGNSFTSREAGGGIMGISNDGDFPRSRFLCMEGWKEEEEQEYWNFHD